MTASFLPSPLSPVSQLGRARQKKILAGQHLMLVYWALLGLSALFVGHFLNIFLARVPPSSLVGDLSSGLEVALTTELLVTFWSWDPSSSLLRGEAALRRLRGFGGERPPALAVSNDEVHSH